MINKTLKLYSDSPTAFVSVIMWAHFAQDATCWLATSKPLTLRCFMFVDSSVLLVCSVSQPASTVGYARVLQSTNYFYACLPLMGREPNSFCIWMGDWLLEIHHHSPLYKLALTAGNLLWMECKVRKSWNSCKRYWWDHSGYWYRLLSHALTYNGRTLFYQLSEWGWGLGD